MVDDAHSKRDTYAADVVAMLIDAPGTCGRAWIGPRKDRMFSVTSHNCATGNYSFGHEIAHNMGCNHDRGTKKACSSPNSNYGYRDPLSRFRTVMSYQCESGQCDNNRGNSCTRIPRFSTPSSRYNWDGLPIGTPVTNNALQINSVKEEVAAYYSPESRSESRSIIFRNAANNNLCLDVYRNQYFNGNKVWLYTCNNTAAQKWKVNSKGEITIGDNYEFCLSGGTGGLYTPSFIWKCNDVESHIWKELGSIGSTGRITSQKYNKSIGVGNGCGGVASQRIVELQGHMNSGMCRMQQEWKLEAW